MKGISYKSVAAVFATMQAERESPPFTELKGTRMFSFQAITARPAARAGARLRSGVSFFTSRKKVSVLVVALLLGACAPSDDTQTAAGGQSSALDSAWRSRPAGTIVEVGPAGETSQLEGAERALFVRYTTVNVQGEPALASGLVLIPETQVFADGQWPLVVYGHMTTGAADDCAPTHGTPESTELRRMQQGDEVARQLLSRGVVVARPDYEGLGEAGPHPYLRGDSLAQAMRDMASAVAGHWPQIGDRWVVAGHSEGGVAALNTASSAHPDARGLHLIGVAAITPVTQLEKLVTLVEPLPVTANGINGVVALAGLVLKGIASIDPGFEKLMLEEGGLSPRAIELWPDLERLCLEDLSGPDSWGGMSPDAVQGPRGDEGVAEMKRRLEEDDVRLLPMRRDVPIRIDAGILDLVALLPFTEQLAQDYRDRGNDVTYARWPAGHSPTADMAAPSIADWIMERFSE
jgi:pimeloyl-ACP methyl ester carboxylesterase